MCKSSAKVSSAARVNSQNHTGKSKHPSNITLDFHACTNIVPPPPLYVKIVDKKY